MKILIVEDEPLAAAQLAALIAGIAPDAKILAVCDTIESTLKWLSENEAPDLAFFDIHLGDGLSFEIFKRTQTQMPIIFTTAYDQYALQAFKVNSIDYLLKPIVREELQLAIEKFNRSKSTQTTFLQPELIQQLMANVEKREYKKRFLVKIGAHLKAVNTNEVCYFYSFQKGTFLKREDGKNYLLDQSLEQVEQLIDPEQFYRINRKYLVNIESIVEVIAYSNSRLKLKVKNAEDDDFLVAREKVKQFKSWYEGEKYEN
jgi:DNA-binding LytR/AlgR family response regulator